MRLFVSVDLPDTLAEPIAGLQDDLAPAAGIDLTDPTQAHLTLKFLGDVDPDRLDDIEAALERAVDAADVDPFEATFEGVGAFPSEEYIRVVWLGVSTGADAFTALARAVEAELTDIGFDPEGHDFTPHVTLGRMHHAGGKERVQAFLRERDPTVGSMVVEEVRLTESQLGPDGPEYRTVFPVPL